MRRPCVQFTVRRMMVFVALVAVACLGAREYRARWLRRGLPNLVSGSQLTASAGQKLELILVTGHPVPVAITYNLRFRNPKPAPGTSCLLWAEVWFEESETGLAVENYTFDAPLTVGGREAVSGSLTWDAVLPRPGRYLLRHSLYYQDPTGEFRLAGGGGRGYNVVTPVASHQPTSDQGAPP